MIGMAGEKESGNSMLSAWFDDDDDDDDERKIFLLHSKEKLTESSNLLSFLLRCSTRPYE